MVETYTINYGYIFVQKDYPITIKLTEKRKKGIACIENLPYVHIKGEDGLGAIRVRLLSSQENIYGHDCQRHGGEQLATETEGGQCAQQ
jgi:hypothetical protein